MNDPSHSVPREVIEGVPVEALGQMVEQGRVSSSERDAPGPRPSALLDFDGRDAYYRLVVAGSEVPGWSNAVAVEGITLTPWHGPVVAQRTYIEQPPRGTVVYSKINHRYDVGHGRSLVVCVRRFALNLESIVTDVERYRRKATGALGAIATVFDERFAVDELAENVIVMDDRGVSADKMMDVTWRTREYSPHLGFGIEDRTALEGLEINSDVSRAARWYLKGVQEGPTADGVIWLCTSIESLVSPLPGQQKRFHRKAIEEAVRRCGYDPLGFKGATPLTGDVVLGDVQRVDLAS